MIFREVTAFACSVCSICAWLKIDMKRQREIEILGISIESFEVGKSFLFAFSTFWLLMLVQMFCCRLQTCLESERN